MIQSKKDGGAVKGLMRILRKVSIWQVALVCLICIALTTQLLRQNSLTMESLRAAVISADTKGDTVQIRRSLVALQQFVIAHMNTDMGPHGVYLQKTYQKAYENAIQQGIANDQTGHTLYEQADAACQPTFKQTHSFPAYTQCVASKLSDLNSHDPLHDVQTPSVDLFRYTFASPTWSPDAAGILLLVSILLGIWLVWKTLAFVIIKINDSLKKTKKISIRIDNR